MFHIHGLAKWIRLILIQLDRRSFTFLKNEFFPAPFAQNCFFPYLSQGSVADTDINMQTTGEF